MSCGKRDVKPSTTARQLEPKNLRKANKKSQITYALLYNKVLQDGILTIPKIN